MGLELNNPASLKTVDLDYSQQEVIDAISQGQNVLMLSPAGYGKSAVIDTIQTGVSGVSSTKVYKTSTTGVSALNIGGVTIHSFMGIGLAKESAEELLKKVPFKKKKTLKQPKMLIIIDEISMMDSELIEKIDYILKKLRGSQAPFGGVQMLFAGDFYQLLPIDGTLLINNKKLLSSFTVKNLRVNHRQSKDEIFQRILGNLRVNKLTEQDISDLENLTSKTPFENAINLVSTNAEAVKSNTDYLNSFQGPLVTFKAYYSGERKKDLETQFKAKDIDVLKLKPGVKVMLTSNLDVSNGLVNGSIGIVKHLVPGCATVVFGSIVQKITSNITELYGETLLGPLCVATAQQLPLILANCMTIHKCQGLTFEFLNIDLKKTFTFHQVYVAISRCKSLQGLHLKNFDPDKIRVHGEVQEYFGNND